jgi:hypothetical protein
MLSVTRKKTGVLPEFLKVSLFNGTQFLFNGATF